MYKLVFTVVVAVVALSLFCSDASAAAGVPDPYSRELVEDFERCKLRLPAFDHHQLGELVNVQHWYLKYMDEIYFNLLTKIALAGKEDRPYREISTYYDSPCFVNVNDPCTLGVPVNENFTSGTLGVTITLETTLTFAGVVTHTIFFPNTQTPALGTTWVPALTNGRTYILQLTCLPGGHLGYQIFSTKPELDSYSIQEIKDYLNKVFKDSPTSITTYRGSVCNNVP